MHSPRKSPIELSRDEFRDIGYRLVDTLSDFIQHIADRPVTSGEAPAQILSVLGKSPLSDTGMDTAELFEHTTDLLLQHSLFNGHPKFMGYITSSPAPAGMLADFLASAVNANVGANILSPMATAIENQTIQWLAEFIGIPATGDGILVSGGNMANLTAFLAGRTAKAPKDLKVRGLHGCAEEMTLYCSAATHAWVEKAAVFFGHGTDAVRYIATDRENKLDISLLEAAVQKDIASGKKPFMVIGNAGDVSTGVVDDLSALAEICEKYGLWFHVDGAYGIPAAALPEMKQVFKGIEAADSIALDPHKWLYAPLEVGCTLVKNPQHLLDTYSAHPAYYNFDNYGEDHPRNYYERGFQNSRGFRALKVWMALRQVGKSGYIKMIEEDMALARHFYQKADEHPEMEAVTQHLSIATMRYVPEGFATGHPDQESYLNTLNEKLLNVLQQSGELFMSNAVIFDKYCLRGCIVNFRTSEKDIEEMIRTIVREGRKLHNPKG